MTDSTLIPQAGTLLNAEQAAAVLGTTPHHLRRLADVHGLPFVQLGGRRKYLRADLDSFVVEHRTVRAQAS